MNRIEFTGNICSLISEMIEEGEHPIIDYVKRSDLEQNRLFKDGKSKCDGIKILSAHQKGTGIDIYFIEEGKLTDPKMGFEHWHKRWEGMGGKSMISWDKGHWEG